MALAQAIAAGLLVVSVSSEGDLPLLELLGDSVCPELRRILHLSHERRRSWFLYMSRYRYGTYNLNPSPSANPLGNCAQACAPLSAFFAPSKLVLRLYNSSNSISLGFKKRRHVAGFGVSGCKLQEALLGGTERT